MGMEASGQARWFERLLAELNMELCILAIGLLLTLPRVLAISVAPLSRSTTPCSVLPAVARTSALARWLPSPRAPSFPGPRAHGKQLLASCPAPSRRSSLIPLCPYPQTQFAESSGGIVSYSQHIGSFSPEPFGWLAPPSLLGRWEPTLSWNQLHSKPLNERNRPDYDKYPATGSRRDGISATDQPTQHWPQGY